MSKNRVHVRSSSPYGRTRRRWHPETRKRMRRQRPLLGRGTVSWGNHPLPPPHQKKRREGFRSSFAFPSDQAPTGSQQNPWCGCPTALASFSSRRGPGSSHGREVAGGGAAGGSIFGSAKGARMGRGGLFLGSWVDIAVRGFMGVSH